MHDRVRLKQGELNDMMKQVVDKYDNTIHSTTKCTPIEAIKDEEPPSVTVSQIRQADTYGIKILYMSAIL